MRDWHGWVLRDDVVILEEAVECFNGVDFSRDSFWGIVSVMERFDEFFKSFCISSFYVLDVVCQKKVD